MKAKLATTLILPVAVVGLMAGCKSEEPTSTLIAEGIVYTLQWSDGAGNTHGMSRASHPESVPGRNGVMNVDLYARLYTTHIEIINKKSPSLGPKIVPIGRLDFVQFGTGGVVFRDSPAK